jgi:hypothetical protein
MSPHAECIGNRIIVVGGYNGTFLNTTHAGYITPGSPISILWVARGASPYGQGVGTSGSIWNNRYIFGLTQNQLHSA